ncbi:Serine/threonine-protein kinase HT1 [Penicillium desertorum]|uniref:Serine/threonine-protein kinase HT1 n=1 Tax=Penicillium desertorum TaxID=1303715 RepID=A0A9X0BKE4_9EURO|nr:Serine/threonine-protein kinase HT1 [Penicillium desertorum]
MASPFLDLSGDPILLEQVLGSGSSAVVVLRDGLAVKTLLRYFWSSDVQVDMNVEVIQREQDVYCRFQLSNPQCDGIVKCLGFSKEATQLTYMANGDLRTYLATNRPPQRLQLSWFHEMARALEYIHDQRVLVADIASRNFLLDSDMTVKFCDFSEASLLPLDVDMDTVDDNGYTTRIALGFPGAVNYEVVTGEKCEIDLFEDNLPTDGRATWPRREFLPSTEDVWLGSIIEDCWIDGGFRNARSLLRALDSVALHPPSPESLNEQPLLMKSSGFIQKLVDDR